MKKSTTKRALFLSFVSMFLCFTMLLGTTYAWFTDNVTSGVNTIVAGNLDVELYNGLDVTTAPAVTENTRLFEDIELWEPGAAVYENFTVANVGNLALKYQFDVVIADAAGYDSFAEVLKVGVVDGGIADNTTREAAIAAVDEWMSFETFSEVGTLAVNGSDTYGVVIYWEPSDRDNEFNMNNENSEKELKVTIGVNLFATQLEAESDSFGSDYDSDAVYADHYASNAAELVAAIAEGGSVALTEDIVLSDMARAAASNFGFVIAKNNDVVINLNGNNIIKTNANSDINGDGEFTSADNQGVFQVKGNLTVVGNGTVSMENTGDDMSWNALSAVFSVEGGTLTLGEGVIVVHNGGTSMSYAVDVNSTGGATALNVDGAILSSTYTGVRVFNNSKTAKVTVNVISGTIDGAKRDIWVHNPSANAVDANAIVNIAESYGEVQLTVQDTSYNSRIYDFDAVVAIVRDAAALKAALEAGKNVVLANDIDMGATSLVVNGTVNLELNGKVLSGVCNASQAYLIYVNNEATLNVYDSSAANTGKITYAKGTSGTGWTIDLKGALNLYSGTIELTGSDWSIGYAVDVRPNAWGTNYSNPTVFTMYGGKLVSSDGAVRVASSSSATYSNIVASFVMNGGEIEAAWDGIFVQQSDAAYDTLNVELNGGKVTSALSPIRVYGPIATSVNSGSAKPMTITIGDAELAISGEMDTTRTWYVDGKIVLGGGLDVATLENYSTITIK